MRAQYDSEADALQIDLEDVERVNHDEDAGPGCSVGFVGDRIVCVELLSPSRRLEELSVVADRYNLDAQALESAARAALASPDREVVLEVRERSAA